MAGVLVQQGVEWRGKRAGIPPQRSLGMKHGCFRAEPRLFVARVRFCDRIMEQGASCFFFSEQTVLFSSHLSRSEAFAEGIRSITQQHEFLMHHIASERALESLSPWILHFNFLSLLIGDVIQVVGSKLRMDSLANGRVGSEKDT